MLRHLKDLQGYALRATDGDIGSVKDFYFDDDRWVVRYLVVETGNWLASRKVLMSPVSIDAVNHEDEVLSVSVTRDQVKHSPDVDTEKPVSRQHERSYLDYYGYPAYWEGGGLWGGRALPSLLAPEPGLATPAPLGAPGAAGTTRDLDDPAAAEPEQGDPHLRSCDAVRGYHIQAVDGEIGHVQGFVVEDESWAIRYLVVDTSNWWIGHKVLVAPQWIRDVSWADSIVSVEMTREAIQQAPEWDPASPPEREHEVEIYKHYDRAGYW